jgi:hypothetical protein
MSLRNVTYSIESFGTKSKIVIFLLGTVFNVDKQISMLSSWVLYIALGTFHQAFIQCSAGTFW